MTWPRLRLNRPKAQPEAEPLGAALEQAESAAPGRTALLHLSHRARIVEIPYFEGEHATFYSSYL